MIRQVEYTKNFQDRLVKFAVKDKLYGPDVYVHGLSDVKELKPYNRAHLEILVKNFYYADNTINRKGGIECY